MLGNDVVDLLDVDARPETFHRRFDLRVFAPEERGAIAADPRPQALRWAHWGAKEAAYKLARQLDPKFVFSPARLVARFEPALPRGGAAAPGASPAAQTSFERRGRLELACAPPERVRTIELRSFETSELVHVVALEAGSDWSAVTMAVEPLALHGGDASLAVRRLALREIARTLGVEAGRLAIGRRPLGEPATGDLPGDGKSRIPTLELDGRTAPYSLSLSHHGRFVAFALAPRGGGVGREHGEHGAQDERGAQDGVGARAGGGASGRSLCARRFDSSRRVGGVGQAAGAVGCPVGAADTAWMVA